LQAVMGYRHMAHIGRGNNNRPYYSKMDAGVSQRREAQKREKQLMMQLRKGASRRK
jgi:hypothetical protein